MQLSAPASALCRAVSSAAGQHARLDRALGAVYQNALLIGYGPVEAFAFALGQRLGPAERFFEARQQ
ncbi:MAG: hypothetical protein ACR2GR_11290, partial [Rhodothermales bacterium]